MVSESTTTISDWYSITNELACYLQADTIEIVLPAMHTVEANYNAKYNAEQYNYLLPLGQLRLLALTIHLPTSISSADIEVLCVAAIKSALTWQKDGLSESNGYDVLILDIQLNEMKADISNSDNSSHKNETPQCLTRHFSIEYFKEKLGLDFSDSTQQLLIFSRQDWQLILETLQTPCELWRYLGYHLQQLEYSATNQLSSVDAEQGLLMQFMNSDALFKQGIAVDNALIKYGMQDKPNSALIAMKLAQKNNSENAQMYQQHMQQAALLWSQLITQMIDLADGKTIVADTNNDIEEEQLLTSQYSHWQQQLRDESLFSRHELVRTLYKHPKQSQALQQSGYVVHQHSYESLGRHYLLIFYGKSPDSQHSKVAIQPNLQKIAQDVATRLPIAELHHIIVLGIEFITDAKDTFMDVDLWIQPVNAMTQKERQLTKKIQRLEQQEINRSATSPQNIKQNRQSNELPRIHLNLSIPNRNDKP